jgi:hypothetical protein
MGIRIKKLMGYSLSLKELNDLGIPFDMSWHNNDFLEDEDKWNEMCEEILSVYSQYGNDSNNPFVLEHMYLGMLKETPKAFEKEYVVDRLRRASFYEFITYNDEYGDPDTILFQPLVSYKDWYRYANAIDYVEASLDDSLMKPKVVRHNHTLYPYSNLMKKNPDSYLGIEHYWESCYLDKPEFKDAVPTCTYSVMLMLKYMQIVSEENLADAIMTIRPTIYSYWS